jgi:sec-independent protein translocase protein TatA
MDIGVPELLIIFAIVLLLFGVGRISNIAGEMGKGIRAFREGLSGESEKEKTDKEDQKEISPSSGASDGESSQEQ